MARAWMLAGLIGLTLGASSSLAQGAGWRFHWQTGQVLTYRVEHNTTVTEVSTGNTVQMTSKLNLIKRWDVVSVDSAGVATLKLSMTAMRHEQIRPSGDTLLFDSDNPDKSTPELREQLGKFVGQTLAVLHVDPLGKVVSVQQGSAAKYEAEPPFVLRLPPQAVSPGQAWERLYDITLEPPLGTGEKHPSIQRYQLTRADGALAAITLSTQVKTAPTSPSDAIPLLQKQPEGELTFNIAAGRLESANLRIDKQVQNHQGEGSSYRFVSTYKEQYVGGK